MPRTKLGDKYSNRHPPLDMAWGAVLCRMQQMGVDQKQLAAKTGYSYDVIRHTLVKPPIEWPHERREVILKALGLKAVLMVVEE